MYIYLGKSARYGRGPLGAVAQGRQIMPIPAKGDRGWRGRVV